MVPYKAGAFFLLLVVLSVVSPFPVSQQPSDKKDKGRQRALPVVISQYSNVRKPVVVAPPEPKSLGTDAARIIQQTTVNADQQQPQGQDTESVKKASPALPQPEEEKPVQTDDGKESPAVVPQQTDASSTGVLESVSINDNKQDSSDKQETVKSSLNAHEQNPESQEASSSPADKQEKPVEILTQTGPINKANDATAVTNLTGDHSDAKISEEAPKSEDKKDPKTVDQDDQKKPSTPETTTTTIKPDHEDEKTKDVEGEEKVDPIGEKPSDPVESSTLATPETSLTGNSEMKDDKKMEDKVEEPQQVMKEELKPEIDPKLKETSKDMMDNHMIPKFDLPIGALFEEDRSFKSSLDEFNPSAFEKTFDNQGDIIKDLGILDPSSSDDLDEMNDKIRLERENKKGDEKKSEAIKEKEKEKDKVTEKDKLLGKPLHKESKPSKLSKPIPVSSNDDPVQEYSRPEEPKKSVDSE